MNTKKEDPVDKIVRQLKEDKQKPFIIRNAVTIGFIIISILTFLKIFVFR